jgi:hypothetical protein
MRVTLGLSLGAALFVGGITSAERSASQPSWDLPAAIICTVSGRSFIGYLASVDADGTARYIALDGGVALVVAEGRFQPTVTMKAGDCAKRTVEDLRDSGKTIEFQR